MISNQTRGICLALLAGLCWGIMSVVAQHLFSNLGFKPSDLVSVRLLASGAILIVTEYFLQRRDVVRPVFTRENFPSVLLYGAGVLTGQYSLFLAISYTNAGTATVLLTTVPLLILLWLAFREGRRIMPHELFCFASALFGVGCLVTKGDLSTLDFSFVGAGFALLSAAAGAFTTIQPQKLLHRIGPGLTSGWGLLAGGCLISLVDPPWAADVVWSFEAIVSCLVIIVVGTVLAFRCFLASTKLISPAVSGLLLSSQPLSADVLSSLFLGVTFGPWELVGAGAVLLNLVILSLNRPKRAPQPAAETEKSAEA